MIRWFMYGVLINALCIAAVVGEDKLIPKERSIQIKTTPVSVPIAPTNKQQKWVSSPLEPPSEYVYHNSKYILEVKETSDVNTTCREVFRVNGNEHKIPPKGWLIQACMVLTPDYSGNALRCQIYLPPSTAVPKNVWDQRYRHELAHCNGWVHP